MNTKSSRFLRRRMTTTTTAKTNTTRAFNASSFNASSSRDRQRREQQRRGETTKSRTVKAVPAWHPENKNDVPFDEPTPGFSSIPSALEEIKKGKFVVVLDDEDRENEGDLIGAADLMTQESMAFMIRHTSGLVCVSMEDERADALHLPLMVDSKANKDYMKTAFTVSCDMATSTTGISAGERAETINALANDLTKPTDLVRPGHVFPLRYRDGGF